MSGRVFGRRVALVEEVLTCAHAPPRIPQNMLVERTTGVNRPLTCYQCQQGFTTSLEVDTHTPKHTILIMPHTHPYNT